MQFTNNCCHTFWVETIKNTLLFSLLRKAGVLRHSGEGITSWK